MSNWEKALRQTSDMLDRLYISAGLGAPWCPAKRVGGGSWASLLKLHSPRPKPRSVEDTDRGVDVDVIAKRDCYDQFLDGFICKTVSPLTDSLLFILKKSNAVE